MAQEIFNRITVDPGICHGKPCIKGTRIYISIIIDWLASGSTFEDILNAYPTLTKSDLIAVLEYSKKLIQDRNAEMLQDGAIA